VRLAGRTLKNTRHICAFFHSADEQNRVLMPFFKEGIDRHEKVFHVVDGRRRDEHLQACQHHGIDVGATEQSGQLEVRTWEDAYLRDDPRYGQNPPHHGMPRGHLPVRSYLAVPVTSRSGEVLGGLFFGHSKTGVFTDRAERLTVGIAAAAALAIDNARLYEQAQAEIAERTHTERALRESERRFRTIVNQTTTGVVQLDAAGRITLVNCSLCDMLGYTEAELVGMHLTDVTHRESLPAVLEAITRLAGHESDAVLETRYLRKDGSTLWASSSVNGVRGAAGEYQGLMGVVVDITDRKRIEREREQLLELEKGARAQAEAASRLKDEFLAVLSHELRTPLNSILGWARMMRDTRLSPERLQHALDAIERNARIQAQLTEDLLDLSAIMSGKLRLSLAAADLPAVVRAAIEVVRPAADSRGVAIDATLPPALQPVVVDADRMQQIVWNLLSNAVKFTPRGGRVSIGIESIADRVQIRVADTGEGISADFLPHVFDRFRQQDSSPSRQHGGLGLGLAIVREPVEAHGGTVHAASAGPGLGTTFTVDLPVRMAGPAAPQADGPGSALKVRHAGQPLAGVAILVVDDDADTRELLTLALQRVGASVSAVGSAASALTELRGGCHDVLIADIGMPVEDGYTLIRRLRALERGRDRRIPALAVTAYASLRDRQLAIAAGYDCHLPKPVDPDALAHTVSTLVGRTPEQV